MSLSRRSFPSTVFARYLRKGRAMSNPQAAFQWYLDVVGAVITDKPSPRGIDQECNFPMLCEKVTADPVAAQILLQLFNQDVRGKADAELQAQKKGNAVLHGTWIMLAYLITFGSDPAQEKLMRTTAGDLFQRAETLAAQNGMTWK